MEASEPASDIRYDAVIPYVLVSGAVPFIQVLEMLVAAQALEV